MSIKGVLFHPVKETCPYLEGKISITENMRIDEMDDIDLELLLRLGFRHFGEIFFRPICGVCRRCIPIRIPVEQFLPSRAVRRLFNRNRHLNVTLEQPVSSTQTYELYRQHKKRFKTRIFDSYDIYVKSFFGPANFTFNRMLRIRDGSKTIALTHLDVTTNAMSAIYCYFDECYSRFSPGTFSIYKEIEICKELGIRWLYLGFYVPGNRHMAYKIRFKPNQLMRKDYKWIDYIDRSGNIVNPLPE